MVNQIVIIFHSSERSTRLDEELGRIEGVGRVDRSVRGLGSGGWTRHCPSWPVWGYLSQILTGVRDGRCRLWAVTK
ncbi:hypothetical protein L484_011168 [Morus notabilis]|uniref:Uncharacterized protein n=1 Tax=Morus notabilis TaxID=981085 RepID=W9RYZ6_9ROSA|nr:hypothetical protein L484_011168 [Morus notabilis]